MEIPVTQASVDFRAKAEYLQSTKTRTIHISRHLGELLLLKRRSRQSRVGGDNLFYCSPPKKKSCSVGSKSLPDDNILQACKSLKRVSDFQEKHYLYILFILLLLSKYDFGTFAKSSSQSIIVKHLKFKTSNWLMFA